MATLEVSIEIVSVIRVDDLCRECWLPSLIRVTFTIGDLIGSVDGCTDCGWMTR